MKKIFRPLLYILLFLLLGLVACKDDEFMQELGQQTINKPPIADAGADQIIALPQDSVVLNGDASKDPDGTIIEYEWTKIEGPDSFVIVTPSLAQTFVKKLVKGSYTFSLRVRDNDGIVANDFVEITVSSSLGTGCNGNPIPLYVTKTEIGNLSDARRPSIASAGSKIVFAGGANRIQENCTSWCNTLPSSAIDIYDVSSHNWSTAQLSQARQGMGAVSCGSKIFFAGGANFELYFNGGIVYNNIDIYDVSTNTWTVAYLSQARTCITAVSLGNKVVFAGGSQDGINGTTRVDIYDISSNTWSTAELSVPRYFINAVVDDNKIYFVGGEDWDYNYNNIDIYDISTNSWSTSALESTYYAITDVMVGNINYWIYYYSESSNVDIKNMSSGTISQGCASYPYRGVFSRNDEIIFPSNDLSMVATYNTVTGQWSQGVLLYPGAPLAVIISSNNTLYMGGGSTGNYTYANKVYAFDW